MAEGAARADTSTGPGRLLVAVYALFALAATGRSAVQLAGDPGEAPVPYALSALAAVLYVLATVALARGGRFWWRVALVSCLIELTGVLTVGAISLLRPEDFPDATVWSEFGAGYAFFPLVLPVAGLWWLWRTR